MIKNTLLTFSLVILLVDSLNARENPFIPTQTYNEEKNMLLSPVVKEEETRTLDVVPADEPEEIIVTEEIKKDVIPIEEIVIEDKKIPLPTKKSINLKEIEKAFLKEAEYNLLTFVKLNILDDLFTVTTKYKLFKYFRVSKENKIVLDFFDPSKRVMFFTKHQTIDNHKYFKEIIMGNHPKKSFFRIVLIVKDSVHNYKINSRKATITRK